MLDEAAVEENLVAVLQRDHLNSKPSSRTRAASVLLLLADAAAALLPLLLT